MCYTCRSQFVSTYISLEMLNVKMVRTTKSRTLRQIFIVLPLVPLVSINSDESRSFCEFLVFDCRRCQVDRQCWLRESFGIAVDKVCLRVIDGWIDSAANNESHCFHWLDLCFQAVWLVPIIEHLLLWRCTAHRLIVEWINEKKSKICNYNYSGH